MCSHSVLLCDVCVQYMYAREGGREGGRECAANWVPSHQLQDAVPCRVALYPQHLKPNLTKLCSEWWNDACSDIPPISVRHKKNNNNNRICDRFNVIRVTNRVIL